MRHPGPVQVFGTLMTDFPKHRITAVIFLGSLVFLFFLPVLLGLRTFPAGDFNTQFLPYNIFFRNELAALHLPVWNPYAYSGHPFLADPQAAVFYPPNDLFTLISLPWTTLAGRYYWLQLEAIAHFLLAGFFTYLFVHDLTKNRMAGVMAGTIFMFSGYLTGYPAQQLPILRTAVWLPLLLWLLLRAFRDVDSWRWWLFFALGYAVAYLGGHPQTFLYTSYVALLWGVFLAIASIRRSDARWAATGRIVLRGGAAMLIFLGLVAAQLLPGVEFTRMSVRASVDYHFLSSGASLTDFWQFLLPSMWTTFSPFYVGVIGVGLAGLAIFGALVTLFGMNDADESARFLTAVAIFFALIGLIALLVSLGRNGPLYPFFYHFAPGWQLFRNQERAAYVVAFSLSVLAGAGVAWLNALSARHRRRAGWLLAGILLAGVVAFFLFWHIPLRVAITEGRFIATVLLTLAGIILLAWVVIGHPQRVWILLALSLITLFFINWDTLQAPVSLAEAATYPPAVVGMKAASEDCTIDDAPCAYAWQGVPGRIHNDSHVESGFGPAIALEDVWGVSPLLLQHYASLFQEFPMDRMWQLTGVEHVLTWRPELFEPAVLLASFDNGDETAFLYRLTDPNPRAWFASEIRIMQDKKAVWALATYQIDPASVAVIAPDEATKLSPTLSPAPSSREDIHIQRLASNRVQLLIPAGPGGLLILSENWMPGWEATLVQDAGGNARNDQLPVVRADITLLGIAMPEGGGLVEVSYQPASVRLGLAITLITLLILAIIAISLILKTYLSSEKRGNHDRTNLSLPGNP